VTRGEINEQGGESLKEFGVSEKIKLQLMLETPAGPARDNSLW